MVRARIWVRHANRSNCAQGLRQTQQLNLGRGFVFIRTAGSALWIGADVGYIYDPTKLQIRNCHADANVVASSMEGCDFVSIVPYLHTIRPPSGGNAQGMANELYASLHIERYMKRAVYHCVCTQYSSGMNEGEVLPWYWAKHVNDIARTVQNHVRTGLVCPQAECDRFAAIFELYDPLDDERYDP